jgi:predicted double-glycine peptidase
MSNNEYYVEMTFPARRQKYDNDCGVACMEAVLTFFGFVDLDDKVMTIAGTNSNGTSIRGLTKVARRYGLRYKTFYNMSIVDLKKYIRRHCPVITPIQAYSGKSQTFNYCRSWANGHYVIPIGYDDKKIYFQDPSSHHRTFLTYEEMNARWHDKDSKGKKLLHFGLVILGKTKTKQIHMS